MGLKFIFILAILLNTQINSYADNKMKVRLNPPRFKEVDFKTLLEKRYSCRSFQERSLNLDDIASILWATCGKKYDSLTGATRTIPSAGATYPLEVYIVVGKNSIDKLKEGMYHYLIEEHWLELIKGEDLRTGLTLACLGQDFIKQAPVSLVVAAKPKRTTTRYRGRGDRYINIEVGHACQNAYLAVTNLGMATVEVGAFIDEQVKEVLGLDKDDTPLSVMPIGYAR
jgi:SagB-type dehydrogenase family enzyme